MAACWNPINKPSIASRSPLAVLSSSTGKLCSVSRKRKNHGDADLADEFGGSRKLLSQELPSSPLRPSRSVKIVPSIEGCSPLKTKTRRTKLPGGSHRQGTKTISAYSRKEAPASSTALESKTPSANKPPKANTSPPVTTKHRPEPPHVAASQPSDSSTGACTPSPIYTPTYISIYAHHGTMKSSLPWTKNGDALTPLECPSDLCALFFLGETISGVENKMGRAFDDIIAELAGSLSITKMEVEAKLGSERGGMPVEIARKRQLVERESKTPAPERNQPSESPLFVTGTPRSRVACSKTATPKTPRFHARETPVTPSISRFQNAGSPKEISLSKSKSKSKSNSPENESHKVSLRPDAPPISPSPSPPSAASDPLPPLQCQTQSPSQPQTPSPSSPPRPPPSSPNPTANRTTITHLKPEPESPFSTSATDSTATPTPSASTPTTNTSATTSSPTSPSSTSASSTPPHHTHTSVDTTDSEASTPTPTRPFTPSHINIALQARIQKLEIDAESSSSRTRTASPQAKPSPNPHASPPASTSTSPSPLEQTAKATSTPCSTCSSKRGSRNDGGYSEGSGT